MSSKGLNLQIPLHGFITPYANQEVVGFIIVRDNTEKGRFPVRIFIYPFAERLYVYVIPVQDPEYFRVLQVGKPGMCRNDD